MQKIIALMCCFNRIAKTTNSISSLKASCDSAGVDLQVILVDDGSSDGTGQYISSNFDFVNVIYSPGGLYWCKSMHKAMSEAIKENYDYMLWLNDDTDLFHDSIERLLHDAKNLKKKAECFILSGSTLSRSDGKQTYGGFFQKNKIQRLSFYPVVPDADRVIKCDAINGNIVLIDKSTVERVGFISHLYEHAFGDIDYSLRGRKLGVDSYVARGYYAYCERNSIKGTYRDSKLSMRKRLGLLLGPKGLPYRSWLYFTWSHGGFFWPVFFIKPYITSFYSIVLKRNI